MADEPQSPSPLAHYDPADLVDSLATGIMVLDAQLCVVYANVAAQTLLAISFNQARGRPVSELFADFNGMAQVPRSASRNQTPSPMLCIRNSENSVNPDTP